MNPWIAFGLALGALFIFKKRWIALLLAFAVYAIGYWLLALSSMKPNQSVNYEAVIPITSGLFGYYIVMACLAMLAHLGLSKLFADKEGQHPN